MAQDIHFSQFYMSPLNLNPALTGVMNCNSRLVANYRNQWASVLNSNAYNTYSVSYDTKIPVGRSDYFGIGGSFWSDVAGESRFGTIQARVSASYAKKMGGYRKSAHYLVFGADMAFTQRRIREGDLRWGTQHDGNGGFDPTAETDPILFDPNFRANFSFADVAAGLLWFSVLDEFNNWYIGAAYHHLNGANVSFTGDDDVNLYAKYTIHAGAEFQLVSKMSILPGLVMFFQGEQREYNIGTSLRFNLSESRLSSQSFQAGLWYRIGRQVTSNIHSDAVIISTRFEYDNYGIGFSYDINISKLSDASSANGAFEFSLNYNICGPQRRNVYCPRF